MSPMNPRSVSHVSARVRAPEVELRNTILHAALLALAALLSPLVAHSAPKDAPPAGGKERFTLTGTKVSVYNLAGTVTVEPTTGTQTVVEVTRGGEDASKLTMGTGSVDGRQSLRVVYPGTRVVYPEYGRGSSTSLRVRDDGTFGGHHNELPWGQYWGMGRTVRISGSGSGVEAYADLKVMVPKGADVIVRHAVGDVHVTNVDSKLMLDIASGAVDSKGTHGDLSIDTGSGSVRVTSADGPLSIDTGSGSVTVQEVKGGPLSIDTGSGEVDASKLDVSSLSVDTGSGHVDLDDVDCDRVHVDTGSGGVSLGLTSDIEVLNIDAGSGEVEVYLPKTAGAMLSLETGSGDMDVDLPLSHLRRDDGSMRAQMGDGNGSILIETGSGGIRIGQR